MKDCRVATRNFALAALSLVLVGISVVLSLTPFRTSADLVNSTGKRLTRQDGVKELGADTHTDSGLGLGGFLRRLLGVLAAAIAVLGAFVVTAEIRAVSSQTDYYPEANRFSYYFVSDDPEKAAYFLATDTSNPADRWLSNPQQGVSVRLWGLQAPFWPWEPMRGKGLMTVFVESASDYSGDMWIHLPPGCRWEDNGSMTTGEKRAFALQNASLLLTRVDLSAGDMVNVELGLDCEFSAQSSSYGVWSVGFLLAPYEALADYQGYALDDPRLGALPAAYTPQLNTERGVMEAPSWEDSADQRPEWVLLSKTSDMKVTNPIPERVDYSTLGWRGQTNIEIEARNRLAQVLAENLSAFFFLAAGALLSLLLTSRLTALNREGRATEKNRARDPDRSEPSGVTGTDRRPRNACGY